ncbi:MFS transporter [Lactobacillus sp. ESL0684]|uniref:MFS transporter n=1 Tax=Lactobacillus sp. ESL0684 TaxID=2983213 RepID=UPI0023F8AF6E|nr:MFS transporter [Lactobacillus sp. ESL0684]WEV43919.1 MFS transporter [Lactobacillus sp. ESL0684]
MFLNYKKSENTVGLLTLGLGGFGIGLAELGIMGLLPNIAESFSISESLAGYLVSGYALAVAVGAILIPLIFRKTERKKLLLGLIILFIIGNALSALSANYLMLLIGRIIAALCHGAFFSVGSVVAAALVPENKKSSAIAIMFAGLTVSNVVGTPLGTFLGQAAGWRITFWAITLIGVLTFIGITFFIQVTVTTEKDLQLSQEIIIFRKPQVWLSTLVSILTFGGLVGPYSYVAFILTKETHFQTSEVPWILLVFGVGTLIGNFIGGKAADHNLDQALLSIILGMVVVLSILFVIIHNQILTIICMFLWGLIGYATAPGLQTRLMNYAAEAPTLGSGVNIAALNVGNAVGAWLGGLTIEAGFGAASPLGVGVILNIGALIILTISVFLNKK